MRRVASSRARARLRARARFFLSELSNCLTLLGKAGRGHAIGHGTTRSAENF